jgi:hypothetical protein
MSDYEKRTIRPMSKLETVKAEVKVLESTGGTKYDQDKPRMDLLPPIALTRVSEVLTFGANKYEDHNWAKGFKWSRLIGAAFRHIVAFMSGESKDPETGISHLAHAICCLMFLLEHEELRLGRDDRRKLDRRG